MTRWRWAWAVGSGLLCAVALGGCKRATAPADLGTKPFAPVAALPRSPERPAAPAGLTAVKLGAVELKLEGCILTFSSPQSSGRFDVAFPEACHFADNGRGTVQTVTTREGPVVLVESSRPLPPNDSGVRDCDTRLRGVLVRNHAALVSESVQKVASCGPGPWDSLMFHVFAGRTIPMNRATRDGG